MKEIFGKGITDQNVQRYNLVKQMTHHDKKKTLKTILSQSGIKMGKRQKGGFLGLLASLGIELHKKGKGMQINPPELYTYSQNLGRKNAYTASTMNQWKRKTTKKNPRKSI